MFALLICATASVAFGQLGVADAAKTTVNCPDDECHVAPFFKGEGGFIGETDLDEVNFVLDCGIVTVSATAKASGGKVAQLLTADAGLECPAGGQVQIHGLKDGGWYWINDSMNSAVASLVGKDALGNATVSPANPGGADITLESMKDGVTSIVKQASTGRIGILHHILPEPPAEAADMCGPYYWAPQRRYFQTDSDCMMGDGSTKIVLTADTTDGLGRVQRISNGMVYRRVSSANNNEVRVGFSIYGADGQGRTTTDTDTSAGTIKGWDITTPRGHAAAAPYDADFVVALIEGSGHNLNIGHADIRSDPARVVTRKVPGEGTTTETQDVPVTHESASGPATGTDPGRGQRAACVSDKDNAATCVEIVEDVGSRRLETGYYMEDDGPAQCRQRLDAYANNPSRNAVIAFAGESGGEVLVLAAGDIDPDFSNNSAALEVQETWVRAWHTAGKARIKILQVLDDNDTPDDPADDKVRDIPEVVCETISTQVEVPNKGTTENVIENGGIIIGPGATTHCRRGRADAAKLFIAVKRADVRTRNKEVTPVMSTGLEIGGVKYAAATVLNVMCPPSAANAAHHANFSGGVNLVPHSE